MKAVEWPALIGGEVVPLPPPLPLLALATSDAGAKHALECKVENAAV